MTVHEETLANTDHLAHVERDIRGLTDPAEMAALPTSDKYWLTQAQRSAKNKWRFARWYADNPNHFPAHGNYSWFAWLREDEVLGTMSRRQRKQIAAEIYEAMGKPDSTSALQIAHEMRPTYAKWWVEFGYDAVVEPRSEIERPPISTTARSAAWAALGVDMVTVGALWKDDNEPTREPPKTIRESMALSDEDWTQLAPLFPPRGKTGRAVDWRTMVDVVLLIHNSRTPWSQIENGSRYRMQFYKSIDAGVWSKIRKALPDLDIANKSAFEKLIHGADRTAMLRRES